MSSSSSSSSISTQDVPTLIWNDNYLDLISSSSFVYSNIPTLSWEDSDLDTDDEDEEECSCESKSGFRSFVCLMSNEECPKKLFHLD